MCSLYYGSSKQLSNLIADATKQLCTEHIDQIIIQLFVACRLIPLAKNSGVWPIGICEMLRRIVGKTIMLVLGHNNRSQQTIMHKVKVRLRSPNLCNASPVRPGGGGKASVC